MNNVKDTKFLFDCDFYADDFDADDSYEHLKYAQNILNSNKWNDVFESWFDYLKKSCKTPEAVINFVNLFSYYGGTDEAIKNPYDFIGYIYYKVDMDKYWEQAGDLFDGVTISILENSGKINTVKDPYYNPLEDPAIISAIQKWEKEM